MNRLVYDASMLVGVCLIGAGVGIALGLGWGLAAAGGAVIATTVFGVVLAGAR